MKRFYAIKVTWKGKTLNEAADASIDIIKFVNKFAYIEDFDFWQEVDKHVITIKFETYPWSYLLIRAFIAKTVKS